MIVPDKQSISDARSYMILELHGNTLLPTCTPPHGLNMELCSCEFVKFKFLHSVRHGTNTSNTFYWPMRDDVADVDLSCVFYGPVHLIGKSPSTIMESEQIKKVFHYIWRH